MRKKLRQPFKISELLPLALKKWDSDPRHLLSIIREKWAGLVGPALARRTRPLGLHSGLLQIGVENSAWANELQLLQTTLLKKIQLEMPVFEIKQLRFQILSEWKTKPERSFG